MMRVAATPETSCIGGLRAAVENRHGDDCGRLAPRSGRDRMTANAATSSAIAAPDAPRRSNAVLAAFSGPCLPLAAFGVERYGRKPTLIAFLLLSGLATAASWICYFRALKLGPAGQVAPIDKLSVVLVAVFAFSFLGERYSTVNWVGIALITAGAVLVAVP